LTKSFCSASETTLLQHGHDSFSVHGRLIDSAGTHYEVHLDYERGTGKKSFLINGSAVERLSSTIGMFPVVVLSPERGAITLGPPSERRKFLDLVLSQLSRAYFDDLLEYRQALHQRNRILFEAKQRGGVREDVLEPWNQNLAIYGSRIIHRRLLFLKEFRGYVSEVYDELVDGREEPGLSYATVPDTKADEPVNVIADRLMAHLVQKQAEECRRGLSLVGPHRDDVIFELEGFNLQKYASQGQHKTFLIALKLAEFRYLKEKRDEKPILLLDDVFSELDADRSHRLLSQIDGLGQTVVTTTDEHRLGGGLGNDHRCFLIEAGACKTIGIQNGKEATVSA
jgi:DNA replication and repair protein RecF